MGGQSLPYDLGFTAALVRVDPIRRLQALRDVSALPHTKLHAVLARAERLGQVHGMLPLRGKADWGQGASQCSQGRVKRGAHG